MSKRLTDSPGAWLAEEVERTRSRRDLSEEGRTAHIGRAYIRAKTTADAARKERAQNWEARRRQLLRPLFGPRQHTSEWRDLRDKAIKDITDPTRARHALDTALAVGDTLEAHAIGAACLDRAMSGMPGVEKWVTVVNAWGESDPHIDNALTELSTHMRERPSMAQEMLSGVAKPRELERNLRWESLVGMADSADESDLTPQAKRAAENTRITFQTKNRANHFDPLYPGQREQDNARYSASFGSAGLPVD